MQNLFYLPISSFYKTILTQLIILLFSVNKSSGEQMEFPKEIKDYCKKCNLHTKHKIKKFKPNAPRTMSWGTRANERKHKSGYGGKARFNATVKKQSKKPTFLAECEICHAKHYVVLDTKMKKIELKVA